MALLVRILGLYPTLVAVAVTAALVPLASLASRVMAQVRSKLVAATDERVKLTTEVSGRAACASNTKLLSCPWHC